MSELQIGSPAPDFTLPAATGQSVSLSSLRGKNVVLYFYPKDDTPGCTREACDFRDHAADFSGLNTVILGVSTDPLPSHRTFIDKYTLPFELLSDEDHQVHERYGAWQEKNRDGKISYGPDRSTFVIDAQGILQRIDRKVKVDGHVGEVLAFIQQTLAW